MVTTNVSGVLILLAISLGIMSYLFWKNLRLAIQLKLLKAKVARDEFELASEIIEEERHRIAAELHDDLGSGLSIIHLNLEIVTREASSLTASRTLNSMTLRIHWMAY